MIFFFDRFTGHVKKLQDTMRCMGRTAKIVVMEENGSLPDGISSPYGCFSARHNREKQVEKDLAMVLLNVPEPWEICTTGNKGTIYYDGCEKASVSFRTQPEGTGLQKIEWYGDKGRICRTDYYGRSGFKYAREFFGSDGLTESKVFYSDGNQEVLVEWPRNRAITLLNHGVTEAFFTSWAEFAEYYMTEAHPGERGVLYVQDQECLELLDIKPDEKKIWDRLLFADPDLLERYRNAGGKDGCRLYAVPESYPVNRAKGEALILTASDRMEGIEYLVSVLEGVTFHIAANTQVSDKLNRKGVLPVSGRQMLYNNSVFCRISAENESDGTGCDSAGSICAGKFQKADVSLLETGSVYCGDSGWM